MSKQIIFNEPSQEKTNQQSLTLEEMQSGVDAINQLLETTTTQLEDGEFQAIQKLIYDYENACHFRSYTSK